MIIRYFCPAKAANYCGIKKGLIAFVVDADPLKQEKFISASDIPIFNEAALN